MCDALLFRESTIEAGQSVLTLLTLLEGDIVAIVACAKLADEDHGELASALSIALSQALVLAEDPVGLGLIVSDFSVLVDVRALLARQVPH